MNSLREFRAARLSALTAEDGWLNLADRIAVAAGTHAVGSAADNDVVISVGPAHLGILTVTPDNQATLKDAGGTDHAFRPHPDAFPRLRLGGLLLELHHVAGEPALRVRDLSHPARADFGGLRYFPDDPAWVIRADWAALPEPEMTAIGMNGGRANTVTITHRARFLHGGVEVTLTPTHVKSGKPMFVFRDTTAGTETYAACRFLFGEDAQEGRITLDFNRAHNPPCAFTDLAVCPLPPPGNILPFPVRAGEMLPL